MASVLKAEKKPPMWLTLYSGTPSSRKRFSSGPPPRTYMPLLPSEPLCTPGISCSALMRSASPNITGTDLSFSTGTTTALICDDRVSPVRSAVMTTSSRVTLDDSCTLTSRFLSSLK